MTTPPPFSERLDTMRRTILAELGEGFEARQPRRAPDVLQVWRGRGAAAQLAGVARAIHGWTVYVRAWGEAWVTKYDDDVAVAHLAAGARSVEALGPPVLRTFPMFAHRTDDAEERWAHVFCNETGVRMCGPGPVHPVAVTVDPAGTYYGWWNPVERRLSTIFANPMALGICFPYGIEVAEAYGDGVAVRLRIEGKAP